MNPNILDYLPRYPPIGTSAFNRDFNNLYEFKNPVVPRTESFPTSKGDRMSHQIILSRIMSTRTPYDGMLLMHDMGTGKTCTAVSIIEQIRSEADSGITKFYYVSKNNDLGANFDYQYRNVCVKGNVKNTGVQTKTYTKFLDEFKDNNNLEGSVVVIDEVHNIKTMIKGYTKILTNPDIRNLKVILMSGTPMTDDPREIYDIMNLITRERRNHINMKARDNVDLTELELRKLFRGRVSYLKSMEIKGFSTTMQESSTPSVSSFKHFKIYPSKMSDHQFKYYDAAFKSDFGSDGSIDDQSSDTKSAAYSNSRQASNFVDDNGSYTIEQLKTVSMKLPGRTNDEKLTALRKYSAKYADSMKVLIKARNDRKNVFVYNRFVKGGGLSVFVRILNLFGFAPAIVQSDGTVAVDINSKRYMVMTGDTPPAVKQQLVERFNRPDNLNGDYIGVVLVSDAISEGYTFKNIQVVDIHSPWFQYAKITQAIARGIRLGSHNALLDRDGKVNVEIYLRASIVPEGTEVDSVDVKTYAIAEKKDIAVKQIEYIIKQEAIDAVSMKSRNTRDSKYDGKRECEYKKCDYVTHPGIAKPIGANINNYSNFQLYYNVDDTGLRNSIIDMFDKTDSIRFVDIVQNTVRNTIPVLAALHEIINTNIPVTKGGAKFYVREDKNIYYLTREIGNNTTSLDMYYNNRDIQTTVVYGESDEKFDIMVVLTDDTLNTVDDLVAEFTKNSDTVTVDEKERLLEKIIEEKIDTPRSQMIMKFFSGLHGIVEGTMYSWYPKHASATDSEAKKKPCRKFEVGKGWTDADADELKVIKKHVDQIKLRMETNAKEVADDMGVENVNRMYYGLYDYKENLTKSSKAGSFVFRIMTFLTERAEDERKNPTGRVCSTFDISKDEDNKKIFDLIGMFPVTGENKKETCNRLYNAMEQKGIVTRYVNHI